MSLDEVRAFGWSAYCQGEERAFEVKCVTIECCGISVDHAV